MAGRRGDPLALFLEPDLEYTRLMETNTTMTDQHPLTDDKCYELWSGNLYENEKMRAAADWQLEQVIEWLKHNASKYVYNDSLGFGYDQYECIDDLRKAMRPTTTQENNGPTSHR